MIDVAKQYHSFGLSVIPVGADKIPLGSWKKSQSVQIEPNGNFNSSFGIGIVCGKVSGNLEVVDIDCKYDVTGKLFDDYKKMIAEESPELLKKLVVEKTPSGGYHFIYRCSEIEGNMKLAQRHATADELKADKNRYRVLIETRGEGGYTMVCPSPKYQFIYRDFSQIQEITPEERHTLLACAKAMNQVYEQPVKEYKKTDGVSCFDDYNNRGDVLALLESHGWKQVRRHGAHILMLRAGGTHKWSAEWHEEKRLFYVWSTSTEFENEKAYNASQVLTILNFKGDYSDSSKWLRDNGYGDKIIQPKRPVKLIDKISELLPQPTEIDEYLETVRNGTFQLGLTTGMPRLDDYFRLKPNSLVGINGHDGVGKSVVLWYFAVLSAINHGWTWVIHAAENKTGGVYRKLIEFYTGKPIHGMDAKELSKAKEWAHGHFTVLSNKEIYTYFDLLEISEKLLPKKALLIDPFNSLFRDKSKNDNVHDYDYESLGEMRKWINTKNCSIYINCHAATEALRRVYPKGHTYEGYPMPPNKADTEGGGKFSNRVDDFMTIHRMSQHPNEWMWTEIHVRKIKEMETGGRPTFYDNPFKIRMTKGGTGFEDMYGFNPLDKSAPKPRFDYPETMLDDPDAAPF